MTQTFASGIPATNGAAAPATCDTDTLETSTGPVQLRADFTPENINLKWYNGDTRVNVATASNSCTYDTAISLPTNPTKPGYKFKGWNIIPGTRVEYIESTGTQWIDTGLPGNNNYYNLTIDFMILEPVWPHRYGWGGPLGNYNASEDDNNWRIVINRDLYGYINTNTRAGNGQIGYRFNLNQRYSVNLAYNRATINNQNYTFNAEIGMDNNTNIYMFSYGYGSSYTMAGRIYHFVAYNNGTLVRNMIPIKDYNGVACMYDLVTKQIFYNSGSGNFIAGPEF